MGNARFSEDFKRDAVHPLKTSAGCALYACGCRRAA